ncbi:FGGY-family carbohydrate kinase [Actinomadura vinacea]|uniref:FGGY-family carbohydrate kinase n=1 Tax=Actinomadura vinacea TaxID=115336 RepID=A0ABP5XL78_9ACTN
MPVPDGDHPPGRLGIDLGTQSVRALLADPAGRVLGRGSAPLPGRRPSAGRHEQDPEDWWTAVRTAVRAALDGTGGTPVRGVAVCSTSGTVLLAGPSGEPLTAGLMYDDGRAAAEAAEAQAAGAELWDRLGVRIQPSWALAKALWLVRRHAPPPGARLLHQADLVTGRLIGGTAATDSSHALKTGYDLHAGRWPDEVFDALGLDGTLLPDVVGPGTVLGEVCTAAAAATGIPAGTPVIAGMTDGCASQLGSGALRVGRWNSVLGTTLVLKGVTAAPVRDPAGVMYSHRSPDGTWLPGGASSVGAGVLPGDRDRLAALDTAAAAFEPSTAVAYPLVSRGERFPFLAPEAVGFVLGEPSGEADRHAALIQGVALVERLALSYVQALGAPVEGPVTFTGGAARSAYWCRLRADVLGRTARIPEHADAALGMAILAAYGTAAPDPGSSLADIAESMVRIRATVEPRPGRFDRFAVPYRRLLDELERRGWLPAEVAAHARAHDR